jgi:predicted alpha/beta-hydrolase family hydrolase
MQLLTLSLGPDSETAATVYPSQNPAGMVLVLAHGAGASQRHPFMTACATGLAARGVSVVTFDFPYMHQKRKVPDKTPVLERCFAAVIDAVGRGDTGVAAASGIFIGGKSMGGRIATYLAAQRRADVAGVLALGYPLHPPGRPDQPRTAHLRDMRMPLLIVQGERDAFGTPAELEPVIKTMTAPVTLHVVAGGDHSLSVRGRPPDDVYREVLDRVAEWMKSSARV